MGEVCWVHQLILGLSDGFWTFPWKSQDGKTAKRQRSWWEKGRGIPAGKTLGPCDGKKLGESEGQEGATAAILQLEKEAETGLQATEEVLAVVCLQEKAAG